LQHSFEPNNWANFVAQHGLEGRPVFALGFNLHWRKSLNRFITGSEISNVRSAHKIPSGAIALVWGQRPVELPGSDIALVRLEDGFLRSVGLGAEFAQPLSWVMDFNHLYFDATGPSRLEQLLQTHSFSDAQRKRAGELICNIVGAGLSKYNTASELWARPENERVILVPGQVETDASLAFGAPGIKTNIELLKTVRQQNPKAWVVYKPHPDVVSGARKQGEGEKKASQWCDEVITSVSIASVLDQVDEVHTLTSLTGFEALIRNKPVTCFGLPFYAGWGLTADMLACSRRTRTLSINELAHAALVQYPMYASLIGKGFITPEQALSELHHGRSQNAAVKSGFGKMARKVINLVKGVQ